LTCGRAYNPDIHAREFRRIAVGIRSGGDYLVANLDTEAGGITGVEAREARRTVVVVGDHVARATDEGLPLQGRIAFEEFDVDAVTSII
jgi:hypothetical protein